MPKQTYENYHKEYYQKNKERILERTRAYKQKYNAAYYVLNKKRIKKGIKKKAQDINSNTPSENIVELKE